MAWTANRTWVSGETLTAALLNQYLRDNLDAAFPVGSLHWRMQAATTSQTTIDGMLLECNATSVLRADFAALNTKLSGLSYPFGTVDGTHMTLPDVQNRSLVAMGSGGHADSNALGDSDAVAKTSRTPKVTIAAHTHSETAHTHTETAHTHGGSALSVIGVPGTTLTSARQERGTGDTVTPVATVTNGTLDISGTTDSGGGGTTGSGGSGTTGSGGGGTSSGAFVVVGVLGVKY